MPPDHKMSGHYVVAYACICAVGVRRHLVSVNYRTNAWVDWSDFSVAYWGWLEEGSFRWSAPPLIQDGGCLNKKVTRFAVERGGYAYNLYLRKKPAKIVLLYLKFNSLSFALGFESIWTLISALWTKIGIKVAILTYQPRSVLKGLKEDRDLIIWVLT
jgi:hypothetical protein